MIEIDFVRGKWSESLKQYYEEQVQALKQAREKEVNELEQYYEQQIQMLKQAHLREIKDFRQVNDLQVDAIPPKKNAAPGLPTKLSLPQRDTDDSQSVLGVSDNSIPRYAIDITGIEHIMIIKPEHGATLRAKALGVLIQDYRPVGSDKRLIVVEPLCQRNECENAISIIETWLAEAKDTPHPPLYLHTFINQHFNQKKVQEFSKSHTLNKSTIQPQNKPLLRNRAKRSNSNGKRVSKDNNAETSNSSPQHLQKKRGVIDISTAHHPKPSHRLSNNSNVYAEDEVDAFLSTLADEYDGRGKRIKRL